MPEDYRWFRQDELVRKCIVTNAYFATMTAGFETALEATNEDVKVEDYAFVKEGIDEFNKRVNLDLVLFVAQVKRSIYGETGFEIVLDEDETQVWLLSLRSTRLKPNVDEDWGLTGFRHEGRDGYHRPEEVLYFINPGLEADHEGLSDVEPIRGACQARHDPLRENFPETVRTVRAPHAILKANTEGPYKEEADRVINDPADVARAGRSIAVNEPAEPTAINLAPDTEGPNELPDSLRAGHNDNDRQTPQSEPYQNSIRTGPETPRKTPNHKQKTKSKRKNNPNQGTETP